MARTIRQARTGGGKATPAPGAQGTLGGVAQPAGAAPGTRTVFLGIEVYLWILVALEVTAMWWLRATFSRYHGG